MKFNETAPDTTSTVAPVDKAVLTMALRTSCTFITKGMHTAVAARQGFPVSIACSFELAGGIVSHSVDRRRCVMFGKSIYASTVARVFVRVAERIRETGKRQVTFCL